ncbi:MAG: hypothetical protein KBA33_10460 [Cloacibacterium sp.]|nr:hypothetical protein [Cloacibacterium sp.]
MEAKVNMGNINDSELRSIGVQNLLNKLPHWLILKGNFLISLLLIIFLIFIGYSVKYPEFVNSKITITPQNIQQNNSIKSKAITGLLTVSKKDSEKIKAGQKVIIKLYDFPYQEFGILEGQVQNTSLIPNGKNEFYVNVIFPEVLKTSFNKNISFDKELKGNAEIVIQDLEIIDAIFHQLR